MPVARAFERMTRMVRYKLVVPLKRSPHPPAHTARGVMVGVFWAMTPFFGIQMLLVLISWVIATRLFKWDFSLINGLAWTWITNIFTVLPSFYLFYVTGALVLAPDGKGVSGYGQFARLWDSLLKAPSGNSAFTGWLDVIVSDVGTPIAIGSLMWALTLSAAAFYLSRRFVIRFRASRAHIRPNTQ